jgi:hypothetical protein
MKPAPVVSVQLFPNQGMPSRLIERDTEGQRFAAEAPAWAIRLIDDDEFQESPPETSRDFPTIPLGSLELLSAQSGCCSSRSGVLFLSFRRSPSLPALSETRHEPVHRRGSADLRGRRRQTPRDLVGGREADGGRQVPLPGLATVNWPNTSHGEPTGDPRVRWQS